jgi:hypothetical protein
MLTGSSSIEAVDCNGVHERDLANITNVYVACGLVMGVPIRTDGGPKAIFDNGSTWSVPIYSCATALKATVKTVGLSVDPQATGRGLASLKVDSVTEKTYEKEQDQPLWGMEESGMRITDIPTVWGMISEEYAKYPNVSSIRQPSFRLPGYAGRGSLGGEGLFNSPPEILFQNLPAHDFPVQVANTIYTESSIRGGIMNEEWPVDMRGRAVLAVYARWSDLSRNASSVGTIIDLIWTDLAASAVVGTKGTLGPGNNAAAAAAADVPVVMIKPTVLKIRYHLAFGIPAFLLLVVIGLISGLAVFSFVTHMSTLEVLKLRLQQLSVGRVFTTVLYPEGSNFTMSPRDWSVTSGKRTVTLDGLKRPDLADGGYGGPHVVVDGGAVTQVTPLTYQVTGDKTPTYAQ